MYKLIKNEIDSLNHCIYVSIPSLLYHSLINKQPDVQLVIGDLQNSSLKQVRFG